MQIIPFFDPETWTLTYLVYDGDTKDAVIIDPVLDFDVHTVDVADSSARKVADKVKQLGLNVHYLIDTHAHADHLTGQKVLKEMVGGKTVIGKEITAVQEVFKGIFGFGDEFATDGSQWDVLAADGVPLQAGSLTIEPIHSPGHTPACYVFKIRDALFTGDVMFMPDFGTGRCDFPGGSSEQLYDSVQRLYQFPDDTPVYVGHDYQPGGRELAWKTSIGESKASNVHLKGSMSKEEFVAFRSKRDATLKPPRLIFQSLQVNAKAGDLPEPASNGHRYLMMPIGIFS